VVAFTVTDSHGAHDTQTATITAALAQNHPPTAIIIIPSATVNVNGPVKLAGSATDSGNDIMSYQWALKSVPSGSLLQPGNLATKPDHTASFTPDRMGQYTVMFTVTDSQGAQSVKIATIVANPTKAHVAQDYEKFESTVAKQPMSAFVPGTKIALVSVLAVNEINVNVHRYGAAAANLQTSILPRMDGCAKSGSPDKNDALRTAAAQKLLYPQLTYLIQELQWLQAHPS
jgi:hypothetical protein